MAAPVLVHPCLGDTIREVLPVSPMDMDVGDATTSALFTSKATSAFGRAPHGCVLISFRPRPAPRLAVLSHGGLRRLLCHIEPELPAVVEAGPAPLPPAPASFANRRSKGVVPAV